MYIYVIMKTMCPPGYHRSGFVATHALMMYGCISSACSKNFLKIYQQISGHISSNFIKKFRYTYCFVFVKYAFSKAFFCIF